VKTFENAEWSLFVKAENSVWSDENCVREPHNRKHGP
jgi:hypothetical protein